MLNLNLERYGRLALNGTEQSKLQLGDGVWERAVTTTTTKSSTASFTPTRVTGGDDVTYPVFSTSTVLPSAKTFGATPVKHKAPKLWGQCVPAVASDTTLYPMVDADGAKFAKNIGLDGTGTDFGYYNEATGKFVKVQGASGTVIQPITYAESDGTQWIDTGVYGSEKTKITIDFQKTNDNKNTAQIVGSNSVTSRAITLNLGNGQSAISRFGAASNTRPSLFPDLNRHTITIANDGYIADGTNVWTPNTTAFVTPDTLLLFSTRNTSSHFYGKIYSSSFTENGTLVRNYIPVRIGTTVELLDLVNWQFATRTGTFTAGADIPYAQLCPDIIKVNTGNLAYGQYSDNKFGIFTDGSHNLYLKDAENNVIATRDIPMLLSEDSYVNVQNGNVSEAWAAVWYDGTQSIPSGYISQTGDLTPNQIVLYPLATPAISTVSIAPFELTEKTQYTLTAQAELPVMVQAEYLGVG